MKANSTDITIKNCKFYNGLGIAMGSIGQYNGQYETIERVTAENIEFINTLHAVSSKHQYLDICGMKDLIQCNSFISRPGQPTRTATRLMEVAVVSGVSFHTLFLEPMYQLINTANASNS